MKKVLIALTIFLIVASGCGEPSKGSPFQSVKPGKSLRAVTQFELIDDFNQGIEKNRRGAEWITDSSKKVELKLSAGQENPSKLYGSVLQINYTLPENSEGKVSTKLNLLDISKAESLTGQIREESWGKLKGRLLIGLSDDAGHAETSELLKFVYSAKDGWVDFSIPVTVFKTVNFNRLDKFELILKNSTGASLTGIFEIDNIAFFGPEELYFESSRDNLKGFPNSSVNPKANNLIKLNNKNLARQIAADTWKFFENTVDRETELVADHIRLGRVKGIGNYTSTTNIAFYWLACTAARDIGIISDKEATNRIDRSLKTVEKLARWRGSYFYNYYNTDTLAVTRRYVSSVDNAWLVAALAVTRQAFPGKFDDRINAIITPLNFSVFEDSHNGQLHIGYDEEKEEFTPYHYGLIVSEARLASYVAIGKGDLPVSHWAKVYRTAPKEWDWQTQVPEGKVRTLFGIPVFEGYYHYQDQKIVPSWGGSLFEFLSPALLLKEKELGKNALGKNNLVSAKAHIHYALEEKKYPIWGIAPAGIENGKGWEYKELGIKQLAVKGYPDSEIIAPYASILAIENVPEEVIKNIKEMIKLYPSIYGPYGFYDAVEIDRKRVNPQYLALDQGMILVAITNYLNNGSIQKWFHQDPIGKKAEAVLTQETFFE